MEVSGQLHAPAALLLREWTSHWHWVGDWVPREPFCTCLMKKEFVPLPGIELQIIQPIAQSLYWLCFLTCYCTAELQLKLFGSYINVIIIWSVIYK